MFIFFQFLFLPGQTCPDNVDWPHMGKQWETNWPAYTSKTQKSEVYAEILLSLNFSQKIKTPPKYMLAKQPDLNDPK